MPQGELRGLASPGIGAVNLGNTLLQTPSFLLRLHATDIYPNILQHAAEQTMNDK